MSVITSEFNIPNQSIDPNGASASFDVTFTRNKQETITSISNIDLDEQVVAVYDINGHCIYSKNDGLFNINTLPQGIFIIKTTSSVKKFIK